jgi:hypothetical protein
VDKKGVKQAKHTHIDEKELPEEAALDDANERVLYENTSC